MTTARAMVRLGKSRETIHNLVNRGELRATKRRPRMILDDASVAAYERRQDERSANPTAKEQLAEVARDLARCEKTLRKLMRELSR